MKLLTIDLREFYLDKLPDDASLSNGVNGDNLISRQSAVLNSLDKNCRDDLE
jgi:hypothetical protein